MNFKFGDLVCPNERLTGKDVESKVVPPMIFLGVIDGNAECFTFDKYGSMSGVLSIDPSSIHLLTKDEAKEAYELQKSR